LVTVNEMNEVLLIEVAIWAMRGLLEPQDRYLPDESPAKQKV